MTADSPLERAVGGDLPDSARPAVVATAADMVDLRDRILAGFDDRRGVVRGHQELALFSLGSLPRDYFAGLTDRMWPRETGEERTLLACLLADDARARAIDPATARAYRRKFISGVWLPCFHRAINRVRRDAAEYINADDATARGADTDPGGQQHVAMRPALSELGDWQRKALSRLLDGFGDRVAIMDWLVPLELATQGHLDEATVRGFYDEPATVDALTGGEEYGPARCALATTHVLPAMSAAARDLAARAGEEPDVALPTPEAKPS